MDTSFMEYNDNMASVHLLAGVGYQEHFPDKQMADIAAGTDILQASSRAIGLVEFKEEQLSAVTPTSGASLTFGGPIIAHNMTYIVKNSSHSADEFGGTSMKTLFHYFQNVRDKKFQRFNYGTDNVAKYESATPPLYNLSAITSKVTMHYGAADRVLDERDVLAMVKDMPNAMARKVARDTFEHSDFLLAEDAKEMVTDYIIESIKKAHNDDKDVSIN
ncbi:lipase 3-like [Phthorimaea operculella]|nr:lipase 3-like [Phthorimaea operculella]